jgi:hypothetical protein
MNNSDAKGFDITYIRYPTDFRSWVGAYYIFYPGSGTLTLLPINFRKPAPKC